MLRWSSQFILKSLSVLSTSLRSNHYESLGLMPSATLSEVKAAYYKLSKIYHPDRNNGSEASAKKFRDIVAAYEVLSKAHSRREYDREIARKYMARNTDFSSKKKRIKKTVHSSRAKSHFQDDFKPKYKQKSGVGGRKGMSKYEEEDFEKFIVRAIPLVIAVLMSCKK